MSKKQMGFTLIEIVMVLVLLGILSAVAVPKYFDLRAQAVDRALDASAAELQSRIMARFSQEILSSTTNACATSVENAADFSKTTSEPYLFKSVSVEGWKLANFVKAGGDWGVADKATLSFTENGVAVSGSNAKTKTITLPTCYKKAD